MGGSWKRKSVSIPSIPSDHFAAQRLTRSETSYSAERPKCLDEPLVMSTQSFGLGLSCCTVRFDGDLTQHRDIRNPLGADDDIEGGAPIPGEMQIRASAGSVLMQDSRTW